MWSLQDLVFLKTAFITVLFHCVLCLERNCRVFLPFFIEHFLKRNVSLVSLIWHQFWTHVAVDVSDFSIRSFFIWVVWIQEKLDKLDFVSNNACLALEKFMWFVAVEWVSWTRLLSVLFDLQLLQRVNCSGDFALPSNCPDTLLVDCVCSIDFHRFLWAHFPPPPVGFCFSWGEEEELGAAPGTAPELLLALAQESLLAERCLGYRIECWGLDLGWPHANTLPTIHQPPKPSLFLPS